MSPSVKASVNVAILGTVVSAPADVGLNPDDKSVTFLAILLTVL
jgi:hypothetical protein